MVIIGPPYVEFLMWMEIQKILPSTKRNGSIFGVKLPGHRPGLPVHVPVNRMSIVYEKRATSKKPFPAARKLS
jgi:hypothetical protein